jgi:transposase
VKRNKNVAADAEAICEAAGRPTMRFVPVKSREQQSALMLHRARNLLIRHRTMLSNAIRGHMAEFGIVEAQGAHRVKGLVEVIEDDADARLPALARGILRLMAAQLDDLDLLPASGGVGSERHAAASMVIPSMPARASAGVR